MEQLFKFVIVTLCFGELLRADGYWKVDCLDAGQGVSYHIILAGNVDDAGGILAYLLELASDTITGMVCLLRKGVNKGFMVGQDD